MFELFPDGSYVADSGFEAPTVGQGSDSTFAYDPTGSPWTFSASSGISGNGSGFTSGNPAAPEGMQVAFLQDTGSISQAVPGWASGTYSIRFKAAQRGNWQASLHGQDIAVQVDGVTVATFTPSGTDYATYTTPTFNVATDSHTISFVGLDSAGGDSAAFIDAVQAVAA